MSLYNMLMGRNPAAPYLFAFLDITQETAKQWPLGRVRDAYTNEDGSKIFIFTRNGPSGVGLNDEERSEIEKNLQNHPKYVRSFIDDFDETYMTYEFNTPEEHLAAVKAIADMTETEPPMARFRKLIDDMAAGKDDPRVKNALEAGKKVLQPVIDALEGNKDIDSQTVRHGDGAVDIINLTPEEDEPSKPQ